MTFDEISNSPCDLQGNTSQFVRRILENLVVSTGSIIYSACSVSLHLHIRI